MKDSAQLESLRRAARSMVQAGAAIAEQHFGKVKTRRKPDDTPVTDADHAVQAAILRLVSEQYPAHAILVEEDVAMPDQHADVSQSPFCWVVDPIDGTRNYGRGARLFATSVGLLYEGRPIAGAIHDAMTGQVYSASAGGGAFLDDAPLRTPDRPIGSDTTIAFSSFRFRKVPDVARKWQDVYLFRNAGSLCLHLIWVATGAADAVYALECKLWDIAAGALIIEEAGGVITNARGGPLWPIDPRTYHREDVPILGGSRTLHAKLVSDLRDAGIVPK